MKSNVHKLPKQFYYNPNTLDVARKLIGKQLVTGRAGDPKAVLVRGIIPNRGIDTILYRRKQTQINPKLVNGPAKLCQALGISLEHNKISLLSNIIWIEDAREGEKQDIIITKRVGVDYAGTDASLPYRFILRHADYRTAK